ncbi:MAG: NAD(P)/FAD-dependent oxidoreductase [Desulfobacterales bacterium]|jgi:thioredoxin reductase (NADPH)
MPTSAYDVVILGLGPAGLQAAVHAARRKTSVLLLGRINKSSLFSAHIENYFSLFNMSGAELLTRGLEQAQRFGAQIKEENVIGIDSEDGSFRIRTEGGSTIDARSLILATGSKRNKLGVPGEKAFLGKGVSYCVDCDGLFFRGVDVCIVGNESAAVDGALTLAKTAREVHLVCDRLEVADALQAALAASPVILHKNSQIKEIYGQEAVEGVRLSNDIRLPVEGVFIELGAKGVLELALKLGIQLDNEMKYIQTNKQQETSVAGIFAAGDICGMPWQLAKAVGEGCVAGISAAQWAKKQQGKAG